MPDFPRRSFLYATTALVGAVGVGVAAWPLLDQMDPDARARAARDIVVVDLAELDADQKQLVFWNRRPIFVVRRTQDILNAMLERQFVERLVDPDSRETQQPLYARNWHRSIEPNIAVLEGACTACRTLLQFGAEDSSLGMKGGYVCPFCVSHYDPAGRAYAGRARLNLPVPPYKIMAQNRIRIGEYL